MAARKFDPLHLDVAAFAKEGATLEGRWPIVDLPRLAESAAPRDTLGDVAWQAHGERREMRGGSAETWLHLRASTRVPLTCQRCLDPVEEDLAVEQSLLFVPGEALAAELDAESEFDVLAITSALNLRDLIEDELLLVLPLVPRHDECPAPLPAAAAAQAEEEAERENPFAALAALRSGKPN